MPLDQAYVRRRITTKKAVPVVARANADEDDFPVAAEWTV